MDRDERSAGGSPEGHEHPRSLVKLLLKLLPHIVTILVGVVAAAELLESYGPSAKAMVDGIIAQMQLYDPYSSIHERSANPFIFLVEEMSPFLRAFSAGVAGWLTLLVDQI